MDALPLDTIRCADLFDLCATLPDKSIDMILCDLPYGTTACSWDTVIPFEPMWAAFRRVIKQRGAIVLTASQPFTSRLVCSNLDMFRYQWHWNKGNATGHLDVNKRPLRLIEDIAVFYDEQCIYSPQMIKRELPELLNAAGRRKNIGGGGHRVYGNHQHMPPKLSFERYPTNYLQFSFGDKSTLLHPTQKPVALFEYLIRTYTQPGNVVLDPCVGSGTTAVAARKTDRRYICGDSSQEYVDIAVQRLQNSDPFQAKILTNGTKQLSLFEVAS